MKKILALSLVGSFLVSGLLLGEDFAKKSNKDLINLAGKVKPKDVPEYRLEIAKRIEDMSVKEAREFEESIRKQAQKVYDGMKVKEFRDYRHEAHKALEEFCRKNKEECKLIHPPKPRELHDDRDDKPRPPKPHRK